MKTEDNLPYTNLQLEDLEGEVWVSALGYDGSYEVSNYGRIKSMAHTILQKNGRYRFVSEKIRSQGKVKHDSVGSNFSLYVPMKTEEGIHKNETVAKIVLSSFSKPSANKTGIHHINGVSSDNRLVNLCYENMRTKRRIEFDLGLRENVREYAKVQIRKLMKLPSFKHFTKESAAEHRKNKIGVKYEKRSKHPITIYFENTRTIRVFTSVASAREETGINESAIRNAMQMPTKFKYIQVKIGQFADVAEFNPLKRRVLKKIEGMSVKTIAELTNKTIGTIYYRIENGMPNEKIKSQENFSIETRFKKKQSI